MHIQSCNGTFFGTNANDNGKKMFSGVARDGVIQGGNRRAPKFFDILKMKIFAIFSFLHRKIEFILKIFRWPFSGLLQKTCKLSQKSFRIYPF